MNDIITKEFDDLTPAEVYAIMKARQDVFVIEQNCPCEDMDGIDLISRHIFTLNDKGECTSCLRLFIKPDEPHTVQIGRVITTERGTGLGGRLLHEGVRQACLYDGAESLYLEAQTYAIGFYAKEGFEVTSEEFLEDGIPHVKMRRKA